MSASKNANFNSIPRDRDADSLAWQLICFAARLLHDIGKLNTTARVFALTVEPKPEESRFASASSPIYDLPWRPIVEGFESWVSSNRVTSYYLDFNYRDARSHREFVEHYIMALIPRPLLAFIYHSNDLLVQQFEDFIRNPESGAATPIFQIVKDADHINVAQSVDPRRKPGTLELSSLTLRRFTEFATESRLNLPNSYFIYAHVQKNTPNGTKFLGVPFFVASETSIEAFTRYIMERPLLGVSLGNRAYELIFNCLESANIMCRTIEGLPPQQLPVPSMQDFIPVSKASIRFPANQIIRPIKDDDILKDDVILDLPVVPIKIPLPSSVGFTAPILAFKGVPDGKAVAMIPVVIEEGKIAPEDAAARCDPNFLSELQRVMDANDISRDNADAIMSIPKLDPSLRAAVKKTVKKPTLKGPLGGDPKPVSAEPEVRDNPKDAEGKLPIDNQEKATTADLFDSQIPKKPTKFYRPDDTEVAAEI